MGKTKRLLLALGSVFVFTSAYAAHAAPLVFSLKWQDNSNNEIGFRGYRVSGPNTTRTLACTVATPNTSCQITDDVASNPCYVVVAYNTFGESEDSNQACTAKPLAPGTLTITVP